MSKLHKINVGLIRQYLQENPVAKVSLNNVPLCKLNIGGEVLWDTHTEVVWSVDKEATSTDTGQRHSNCVYCKEIVETTDIPATGYFRYRTLPDNTLAISAWDKNNLPKVLVIPDRYDGKWVTKIDEDAFSGTSIRCLVVPYGIHIGQYAFMGCKNLLAVANDDGSPLLDGTIEGTAFLDCDSLDGVMIEYGANVSPYAFSSNTRVFCMDEEIEDCSGEPNFYFYSEEEKSGNYWRWVMYNGRDLPTVWGSDCDKIGHSDFYSTVDPTCTEYGYVIYGCLDDTTACGITLISLRGGPIGHDWVDATCTTPKTCSRCGKTTGSNLGHRWVEGDCFTKTTCSVCGTTRGDFIHNYSGWVYNEDDQSECRVCTICGNKEVRDYFVQYTRLPNGAYQASGTANAEGIVRIKETYEHSPVIEIAPEGFKGTNITGIILPSILERIGDRAFEGCTKLKEIIINRSLQKIGNYSFEGCGSLEYVFYSGTEEDWNTIEICKEQKTTSEGVDEYLHTNTPLLHATRLYYSATAQSGLYWYYSTNTNWNRFPAVPWGDLDNFEVVDHPTLQYTWLIRLKVTTDDNGNTVVPKLTGTVILPPVLDDKLIRGLAKMALYQHYTPQKGITNIKIPESYKYIYDGAFAYCSNADTLHIPKNIIYVGKGAFAFTSPISVYFDHRWPGDGGMQWHPQWDEYSAVGSEIDNE